jgi:hypothetical protein
MICCSKSSKPCIKIDRQKSVYNVIFMQMYEDALIVTGAIVQ